MPPLRDRHEDIAALSAELEDRGIEVYRPGFVSRPDLPDALRRAQIHIVPSRWDEPFGLTTVEGMATGLAMVVSRTGGTPELIGDAGLLFERDSAGELAAHLEWLVCDAPLRSDYGRRARQRAEDFPWERTWGTLQALLS